MGVDGDDLIDLGYNWAPSMLKAEFIAPHAPFACDMGGPGRQWFSVQDRTPEVLYAGIQTAAPLLDAYLDQVLAQRRLDDSHLALVGFSQGAMMALHVGLRRPRPLAGIVAIAGKLHGPEHLADEIRSRPPVLLVHGDQDPMVPYASMAQAEASLRAVGVPVSSVTRPGMGHGIDDDTVDAVGTFLETNLIHKAKTSGDDDHDHDHE